MNRKIILRTVLAAVLALALVAAGYFLAGGPNRQASPETFAFEEEQVRQTEAPSAARGIRIPGYSVIPVPADTADVQVELYNPEDNEVYFQISFFLKGDGEDELLYESRLLKPGQHIYDITLTRGLPAGDHPITIQYSTFTTDGEFSPRNGATVDCVIRAQ